MPRAAWPSDAVGGAGKALGEILPQDREGCLACVCMRTARAAAGAFAIARACGFTWGCVPPFSGANLFGLSSGKNPQA